MSKFTANKKSFGNILKMLIDENNLDNSKLSRKTKIDRNYIACYIKGTKEVPLTHLITLANFFDVSVSYLIGETEIRNANDICMGEELGLNDEGIDNLKTIKGINEKYNNKYSSLVNRVITNTNLYNSIIKQTELMLNNKVNNDVKNKLGEKSKLAKDLEYDDYADIFVCQKFLETYHSFISFQTPCNLSKLQLEKQERELKKQLRQIQTKLKNS